MEFISFLQHTLISPLPQIIAAYEGEVTASSLSEMETAIRDMSQAIGGEVLAVCLAAQTPQYPEDKVVCPHCRGQARYVRWREGMSITLFGRVHYCRRYYGCPGCQRGHYPLDQALGADHEILQGSMNETI